MKEKMYDLLFKNGFIIDGTGAPWFKGDIAVKNKKIADMGVLDSSDADRVIDVSGFVVSPGFIDIHSHSDRTFFEYPLCESRVYQGITTDVVGNCGISYCGPLTEKNLEFIDFPDDVDPWHSLSEYRKRFKEIGISMNAVPLLGFGTVRKGILGYDNRAPTNDEIRKMKKLIAQAMEEGAFGMSTGLMYPPQNFAKTSEVIKCAKTVAQYNGIYTTHIRRRGFEWGDRPLLKDLQNFVVPWAETTREAIREAIKIGEEAHIPVHISHLKATGEMNWGKMDSYLKMIEAARKRGVDVTFDTCYPPYKTRAGIFTHQLPAWILGKAYAEGGLSKLMKDPAMKERIKKALKKHMEGSQREETWKDQLILRANSEEDKPLIGKTVQEAAEMRGKEPLEFALDAIAEDRGIEGISFVINEEDLLAKATHPFSMICSDSAPTNTTDKEFKHPRYYGTFTRWLRLYVREKQVLTWEEAIHKITGLPATRLGLWNRGTLRPGNWADITIFDPVNIRDNATYQSPIQLSEGVEYLVINGVLTIKNGNHTEATPGKVLSKPSLPHADTSNRPR